MSKKKYTALILGSTGLIGTEILQFLLKNEAYTHVYAVSRQPISITDPKLIPIIADYDSILPQLEGCTIDHLYCAIGTTKNKVPDETAYYKIDHDYPILVASYLKNKGCKTICIVSSIGANVQANQFYLKLKGKVEQAIIALGIPSTFIFRPSLLMGKRKEKRLLESIAQKVSPLLNIFLRGRLKNYQSIAAHTVASAMVNLALSNKQGTHIYQTQEIKENA